MEHVELVKCLRCGDPIEGSTMGRSRELCLGCKYDLILINNERVRAHWAYGPTGLAGGNDDGSLWDNNNNNKNGNHDKETSSNSG